jgi:hypothetical protein
MSQQAHFTQAIAEQRQAELFAAAAEFRLASAAATGAEGCGATPAGRRAGRQLVGWFSRRHATT